MQPRVFCLPWLQQCASCWCRSARKQHLKAQSRGPASSRAASGVQCFPVTPACVLSHSPLGQMRFFTLGSNSVFRIFWAKWRKINSLSPKRARILSLQCWKAGAGKAFHQPCFLPRGGRAECTHHRPQIPGTRGQPSKHTRGEQCAVIELCIVAGLS